MSTPPLADLGVPSFAFINGAALGGGLEIALQSTYRTVSTGAGALALPEAFIGLVPGWGGVYLLPRLIGPENAVKVMIENPLSNNRTLDRPAGLRAGHRRRPVRARRLPGAVPGLGSARDLRRRGRRSGPTPSTPPIPATAGRWAAAVAAGRQLVEAKTSNAAPAPGKVLDVMEANRTMTPGRIRGTGMRNPGRPDADRRIPLHRLRLPGPGPEAVQASRRRPRPQAGPARHQGGRGGRRA